jgi:FAD/FMN-containing dehydrogenase/Fe-S oxidoreductase
LSLVQLDQGIPVPQANSSLVNAEALRAELEQAGVGEVRFDTLSRALYSTDASVYQIRPLGVVIPKKREDILKTLEICRKHRAPITMRGGGTSQAGQAIGDGIQIDLSKYYNRLLEVNAEEHWARVEPGIVLDDLNAQLAPLKLRFAPDISTASRATIGGMMANNSAGARSVLYGKTIDHVLEQTVGLSDGSVVHFRDMKRNEVPSGETLEAKLYGATLRLASEHAQEIEKRYPKVVRRVGGYNLDEFVDPAKPVNLSKLMVGSEGTLGIVLDAKLRLVSLPKFKAVMVIGFDDLLEALAAAPVILEHKPSAIEVMDKSILDHTRQNAGLDKIRRTYIAGDPAATLCVEMYAGREEDLPPRLAALERDLKQKKLGASYRSETSLPNQAKIWSLREAALGLSMAMKEDAKSLSFVEDTAVPPERLSEYIGRFLELLRKHGTTAGVYAHASVGCLHVRPVVNMKTEEGIRKFESIAEEVKDLVLEFGGALSGEHGDGLVRSPFMRAMFGDVIYEAFREVKRTADPLGILNPGKIVDAPPIASNLRFGSGYKTRWMDTWFDYSAYKGIGGAIEMCSGVGACRKNLSGTMCPSYMATRDETHTTRGRANVLRLGISGALGETPDDVVLAALDLCLECRACKAECPVGVDMAAFKSEFLADHYARFGTPIKARALGNLPELSVWAGQFSGIANALISSGAARWFNEKVLGVDKRRGLPKWSKETFTSMLGRLARKPGAQRVTLFNDTFLNHYHPEVGVAAIQVLERGGCNVDVVRPGCCGRPLISQGLLKEARDSAATLVDGLHAVAQRGEKILFCEPSCLSAVKEDAISLLRGDQKQRAKEVAAASILFDEYAAGLDLPLRAGPSRILLHGHCHQKSMGMLDATSALLAKIPEAKVVDLDAGCCGMAGSFGYTHYDVSLTIANRKLLPAVKAMKEGEVLVATGTSCRQQVKDLAGAGAVHPAVLLSQLLDS